MVPALTRASSRDADMLTVLRIADLRRKKTALGIWFIGGANMSVEVGREAAKSWKLRLPITCRLAFHKLGALDRSRMRRAA